MKASPLVILLVFLGSADSLPAQQLPVPPCTGPSHPAANAIGGSLNQLTWIDDESIADWSPPDCTGWEARPVRALLAGAGRFRMSGDSTVLAERVARISAMTDIVYWSKTRNRWRQLFQEANALASPDRDATRADFEATDLVADAVIHFWLHEDNPTNGVVYRLLIRERTPGRLVFETANVSPLKTALPFFRRTIANPGEFRQLYFLQRESEDVWHYYTLVRMSGAGTLAGTSDASLRNRAEAYFRHIAGLEQTREPPAAP